MSSEPDPFGDLTGACLNFLSTWHLSYINDDPSVEGPVAPDDEISDTTWLIYQTVIELRAACDAVLAITEEDP